MLSKYFKFKIKQNDFIENAERIKHSLKNKKVIIFGDGESFIELNKQFKFSESMDIIAFLPPKKDSKLKRIPKKKIIDFKRVKMINFDQILITGENSLDLEDELIYKTKFQESQITRLFEEAILDECGNMSYLLKYNFEKRLEELKTKLKDKKVLFYGGGLLFELICHYFDLSSLNIIGVVDKKCHNTKLSEQICGYKLYSPKQILELNPDYVAITTRRVIPIAENLYFNYLKNTNIKLISLVKRNFIDTLKEG